MITVSLATREQATAVTSLAPSLAMPRVSYSRPTIKPLMFCRKTRGTPRWLHSCTKCAPFSADSLKRMPLLATIPTRYPYSLANPQTRVSPYCALNSWNREPSTILRMTSRTSYGRRTSVGTTSYSPDGSSAGSSGSARSSSLRG